MSLLTVSLIAWGLLPALAHGQSVQASRDPAATTTPDRFTLGVRGGVQFATMFGEVQRDAILGEAQPPPAALVATELPVVGGFVAVAVNRWLAIQVEALYARYGGIASGAVDVTALLDATMPDVMVEPVAIPYEQDYTVDYLSVPILARFAIPYDQEIHPHILGGVRLGFALAAEAHSETAAIADMGTGGMGAAALPAINATTDIAEITTGLDVGVVLGVGVRWPLAYGFLLVDARYDIGVIAAVDGPFSVDVEVGDDAINLGFAAQELRTSALSLNIGYGF